MIIWGVNDCGYYVKGREYNGVRDDIELKWFMYDGFKGREIERSWGL